jgi:DNA-binding Lrp family transcriptional regulator
MNVKNDMAWPSVARIAGECGLSESTVHRQLKVLRDDGWLTVIGNSNVKTKINQASFPQCVQGGVTQTGVSHRQLGGVTQTPELNKELNNIDSNRGMAIPDLSEILEYAKEKQYTNFDHESFFDFYQSKGWMVGKNKMKDWKAAVRNWNKRNKNANSTRHAGQHNNKGKLSGGDRTRAARQAARDRLTS